MSPHPGQLVNGRYRLVRLLGDGGMGTVFEARHEMLGTTVALKFLHPHLARRPRIKERFLREAQLSARIKSPHVVSARDVDQTEEGDAFMVMDYIAGGTLLDYYETLRREGRWLSRPRAFGFMTQILDGVEAAHALGIVHRDLKPDNVMLATDPNGGTLLKILDFGVAKLKVSGDVARSLTIAGTPMGTPEYMAPEQAISADMADHRADVFALGVILYEMLSGRRPVEGHSAIAIAQVYLRGEIPELDVEPDLAQAIMRALAPVPEDRFASVAAFREAILRFLPDWEPPIKRARGVPATMNEQAVYAPTVPGAPLYPEIRDEETIRPLETPRIPPPPPTRRRRTVWPILGAIAAAAAFVMAGLAYPSLRDREVSVAHAGAFHHPVTPTRPAPTAKPTETPEPAPEPLNATVAGSSDGWNVRVDHSRIRDPNSRVNLAVVLERREGDALKPAPLRRVTAALAYYLGHTPFTHQSAVAEPVYRYPFTIALPQDGKYHLDLDLESTEGSHAFTCDICIGADPARCPRMRPSCVPRTKPQPAKHPQPKPPTSASKPPPQLAPAPQEPPPPAPPPPSAQPPEPTPPPPSATVPPRDPQAPPRRRRRPIRFRFPPRGFPPPDGR